MYIYIILLILFQAQYYYYYRYLCAKAHKIIILQNQIRGADTNIVKKNGNHLFGLRTFAQKTKVDLRSFTQIIALNHNSITVESNITIQAILDFLIPKGYILSVTPDMSHLTMGGIVAGIGGGSSSFRHGYFHESLTQFDIIIGNGELLTCSPHQNKDLFYGVPNTLGTLGYITQMTLTIRKCKPYVKTTNYLFSTSDAFFKHLEQYQQDVTVDFLDGTIFGEHQFVLIVGQFKDMLKGTLDNFVNDKVYWQSIMKEKTHWFTTKEYIYRWDTDMYYTSMIIPSWMNNPGIRRCIPASCIPYIKKGLPYVGIDNDISDIVADVLIPFPKMRTFYQWYHQYIGLYPVYICPAQSGDNFSFWKKDLLCDFGIGYGIETDNAVEKRDAIEQKMLELGGRKFLYSRTTMSEDHFWKLYDKQAYMTLRKKYHAKSPQWYNKVT